MTGKERRDLASGAALALSDAHCHLGFADDAASVAEQARSQGVMLASMGAVPEDFESECETAAPYENVIVGVGLHPWWAAGARDGNRLEMLLAAIERTRIVGEVGLDFSGAFASARDDQLAVFRAVASACAREGDKTLSVHAVRAAGAALDILEESGALRSCTCVIHWFSGGSEELSRAIALGCSFSVGERMLATRRGRAYARAIPKDRILLETDAPPTRRKRNENGALEIPHAIEYPFSEWRASLERALDSLVWERSGKEDPKELCACIGENFRRTFLR